MRLIIFSFFLFAVTACSDESTETVSVDDVSATTDETATEASDAFICYPETIGELVGQPVAMLQGHPDKPSDVRLIGPETLVTQEYMPNRLNVRLNGNGTIISMNCG